MVKDAVHYDCKPIHADQCSSEGNEMRMDAVPLHLSEATGNCQWLGARARAGHSLTIDEPVSERERVDSVLYIRRVVEN